ncbi:MAG TPA: tRNA epoxyqueuosine(34) reductase QueG [Acidobacteriota bacterium]|nr:tRNA epoxyqueuosine(34) reductase QueG [Acidobacteriota bacterium]
MGYALKSPKGDSEKSRLTSRIREEARRLGFFRMGVAPAGPLPGQDHFGQWIKAGMHGEMAYMDSQAEKRRDPRLVLENARSIVVLAMNYHCGRNLTDEPLKGRISRYAWGDDYHLLIKDRVKQLQRFITREVPQARGLSYVDTGPVMEKIWGARTSLGWMGKHTNLITQEQGSWFFIAVILLNLELEYDSPLDDHCGTCMRCIDACPTKAIIAPYVVDARLCISYLTIELRGPIPRELRPLIGNRIYGCDDCQEVCPWNRFAVRSPEQGFEPRDGNLMPELTRLVQLTPAEFNKRFERSAIRRAKRDGFVRNVVVALGNSHRPEAVAALRHATKDPSALVRAHAMWALGQIRTMESRQLLESASAGESDPEVRREIALALDQAPRTI